MLDNIVSSIYTQIKDSQSSLLPLLYSAVCGQGHSFVVLPLPSGGSEASTLFGLTPRSTHSIRGTMTCEFAGVIRATELCTMQKRADRNVARIFGSKAR